MDSLNHNMFPDIKTTPQYIQFDVKENLMRKILMSIIFVTVGIQSVTVYAASETDAEKERYKNIITALEIFSPGTTIDSISPAPVPGLVEVVIGPRLFYFSDDGRFLVNGSIIDVMNQKNVTEPKVAAARKASLDQLDENSMIIFSPKEPKHTVTVFTDIDCGYCRKLHSQIDQYNDLGIQVRYLLYPRTKVGSSSYNKAVSVWCSKDRKKTFTEAKSGKNVENKECSNPVSDNMQLGGLMGVRGTPSIMRSTGEMIPGYLSPRDLLKKLETEGS